jgi:hypothetical protein
VDAPDDEQALLLSEQAFARRLTKEAGRPLWEIGSREYTEFRALSVIEYAQQKILESRNLRKSRKQR